MRVLPFSREVLKQMNISEELVDFIINLENSSGVVRRAFRPAGKLWGNELSKHFSSMASIVALFETEFSQLCAIQKSDNSWEYVELRENDFDYICILNSESTLLAWIMLYLLMNFADSGDPSQASEVKAVADNLNYASLDELSDLMKIHESKSIDAYVDECRSLELSRDDHEAQDPNSFRYKHTKLSFMEVACPFCSEVAIQHLGLEVSVVPCEHLKFVYVPEIARYEFIDSELKTKLVSVCLQDEFEPWIRESLKEVEGTIEVYENSVIPGVVDLIFCFVNS